MATIAESSYVQCPFFVSSYATMIGCEGIVAYSMTCKQCFQNDYRKKLFMKSHCYKKDGGGCEIYVALMQKYDKK